MSLREVREKIDGIDREIVTLLDRRAEAGRAAGILKKSLGLPLRDRKREDEVAARIASLSNGSMPKRALERIYRAIMSETLAQEDAPVPSGDGGEGARARSGQPLKRDFIAEMEENREIAPGFHRMLLRAPGLGDAFRPGQFFQFRVPDGDGLFLRRPFAPSFAAADGLAFVYAAVGEGTRRMASLAPGRTVRVLAPLGNAFTPLDAGSRALLVGGGCGAPSLAALAAELRSRGVATTAILGARTASALLELSAFAKTADRLIPATDDGSHGLRGNVLDAYRLEERDGRGRFDRVYACGPMPMLRAVAKMAEEKGVPCEVSLEERMACGFGACMGCAVPVRDAKAEGGTAYRRVCHDGPVFDSRTLAWDAMRIIS